MNGFAPGISFRPMNEGASVGIAISFTAGVLSFLSPCVLPLIPSYVTFVTGIGLEDLERSRRAALVHALLFVAGFTLVFLTLGATATLLGRVLFAYRDWLARIGGVLIIVFGLYLMGVFRWGALSRERRFHLADKPVGYLGSAVVGMAFGAGWTPCIGPILGSILAYTSTTADLGMGMRYLGAYSFGLALPFILAAIAIRHFIGFFARIRRQLDWITRAAGLLMIFLGILLITNYFTILATWLQGLTPEFLRSRL